MFSSEKTNSKNLTKQISGIISVLMTKSKRQHSSSQDYREIMNNRSIPVDLPSSSMDGDRFQVDGSAQLLDSRGPNFGQHEESSIAVNYLDQLEVQSSNRIGIVRRSVDLDAPDSITSIIRESLDYKLISLRSQMDSSSRGKILVPGIDFDPD